MDIFDLPNVDLFIENSNDESVKGSWKRVKEEIKKKDELLNQYSELETWAIENHFDNEHCTNILDRIEKLRKE